jgi:hypothetical protein|tara:strand:+ start:386 stop:496 length:111 start_codon:yes stop_codon:yes gene_type:complete
MQDLKVLRGLKELQVLKVGWVMLAVQALQDPKEGQD